MSVHNFCLKLFIITAINHLHAYTIRNTNYDNDNYKHTIKATDVTRNRHRQQKLRIKEAIPEADDFDLRNEIQRKLIRRIIERRIRDYNLDDERSEDSITYGKRHRNTRGPGYYPYRPYFESEREDNRRRGEEFNRVIGSNRGWNSLIMNPNTINSDTSDFYSNWKPIVIDRGNANLNKLDINDLLEPEDYSINYQRGKPLILDPGYDNSDNIHIKHLLEQENRGSIIQKPWRYLQVNPDEFNINNELEPDNERIATIQRWEPARKHPNLNKINRKKMLRSGIEDNDRNNGWKTISRGRDYNSNKIEMNDLLPANNDEIVFNEDTNKDSDGVLTDDDIEKIKLAIELEWQNVNKDEIVNVFKDYWHKLIVAINRLNERKDQEQKEYLLSLLEKMKESVINNPEYINIYFKRPLKIIDDISENKESDSLTGDHALELHETPINELTIDMPPSNALIRKICEGVNQNVEDFWKIFYNYIGKQSKDRENIKDLEKLYLILTIFTQFNKAKKWGSPIEEYVDKIIQIIEPDIHSLGPILNINDEPDKSDSNIECLSCNDDKVKKIIHDIIKNDKAPEGTGKIISEIPNHTKYIPKVEDRLPVQDHKNVSEPTVEIMNPVPNIIDAPAKPVKPILDLNELEDITRKPLPKEPKPFIEIDLPADEYIEDLENKDDINKQEGDTAFFKPPLDVSIVDSDIKNIPNKKLPANKELRPILDLDKLQPKPDLEHQQVKTVNPLTDLEETEVKTISPIQKPPSHLLDLDVQRPKPEKAIITDSNAQAQKPVDNLNIIDKHPVKSMPDRDGPHTVILKPISDSDKIVEIIPDLTIESKTTKPLEDMLHMAVTHEVPHSKDLRDKNIKSISDIIEIIVEETPDLNNLDAEKIKLTKEVNDIHETPMEPVLDSDNIITLTAKPISELNNIEKVTVDTMPDINNLEANTIMPLEDLLHIDVIKPEQVSDDVHSNTIKPSSDLDIIKEILVDTLLHLNKPDEEIKPIPNTNSKGTKLVESIPDSNNIETPINVTPSISNLNGISGNQIPDLNKLIENPVKIIPDENNIKEKPFEPTSIIEDHIVSPMPESDNIQVLPISPVPHVPVQERDEKQSQQIDTHVIPISEAQITQGLDTESVATVQPISHIIDVETKTVKTLPELIHQDKNIENPNKIDDNFKSKIIELNKIDPDLSIKDIKNIIEHGKLIPELNENIDVQNNSPKKIPHVHIHEFEVKHPDIAKYLNEQSNVPATIQDEYVGLPDSQNLSNLPDIENQIISKDIPRPSNKGVIKDKMPVKNQSYHYVTEKGPLVPKYDVVDVHEHEHKPRDKIEPQTQTSVEFISNDSLDLLANVIIIYLKRLIKKMGLDVLLKSINFDLIIGSFVKILLILIKALTSNGVSLKILMKLIMEVHDKLRLFQTPELKECLRKVYAVVVDIIASIVMTIMQNLSK